MLRLYNGYGADARYLITICTHNRACYFGDVREHFRACIENNPLEWCQYGLKPTGI